MDGRGVYGITNQNSIGVELCQDVNTGTNVWNWDFHATTRAQSILVFAYLMKQYNVPLNRVVRHYDASRKSCPGNWMANDWVKWRLWKKDLETYVTTGKLVDSQRGIDYGKTGSSTNTSVKLSNVEVARQVLRGDWSNGQERKNRLTQAGYDYNAVQAEVQKLKANVSTVDTKKSLKTVSEIASEVLQGLWSNGVERKNRLTSAGYNYDEVQAEVQKQKTKNDPVRQIEQPTKNNNELKYKFKEKVWVRKEPHEGRVSIVEEGYMYDVDDTVNIEKVFKQDGITWGQYTSITNQQRYVKLDNVARELAVKI